MQVTLVRLRLSRQRLGILPLQQSRIHGVDVGLRIHMLLALICHDAGRAVATAEFDGTMPPRRYVISACA